MSALMTEEARFDLCESRPRPSQYPNVFRLRAGEKNSLGYGRELIQMKPGIHPMTSTMGVLVRISYPTEITATNEVFWSWAQTFLDVEAAHRISEFLMAWPNEAATFQTGHQSDQSMSFMKSPIDSTNDTGMKMRIRIPGSAVRPSRMAITKITLQHAEAMVRYLAGQLKLHE